MRENQIARLQAIHDKFDADPDQFLGSTENLTDDDHSLVGKLIQAYCWGDYCGRRVIDAIREAAFGPGGRNASTLQDSHVFPKLKEAALLLWDCDPKRAILEATDILQLHFQMRHNFAHWAARRVPKEDVIVILSKNAREGKRRHGLSADVYETNYGFFYVPDLAEEMRKIDDRLRSLSVLAYELEHRVAEMRATFDELGMHPIKGRK